MNDPQANRSAVFTVMFETHYGDVLRYSLRRSRNRSDAEESTAEVFLVAWRRFDDVPAEPATLPWLYATGRRVIANRSRREQRQRRLLERLTSLLRRTRTTHRASAEVEPVLEALERLPANDREVLRLTAWEGLSHADIGAVLGCTAANVSVRLHRARKRLSRELNRSSRGAMPLGRAPLDASVKRAPEEETNVL